MRAAMSAAPLGDGEFDEDTTTKQLEEMVAGMVGKEAGLWCVSSAQANLICAMLHCCGDTDSPQGDYIVDEDSSMHCFEQEAKWGDLVNLHPRVLPSEADGTMSIATLVGEVWAHRLVEPVPRCTCCAFEHDNGPQENTSLNLRACGCAEMRGAFICVCLFVCVHLCMLCISMVRSRVASRWSRSRTPTCAAAGRCVFLWVGK